MQRHDRESGNKLQQSRRYNDTDISSFPPGNCGIPMPTMRGDDIPEVHPKNYWETIRQHSDFPVTNPAWTTSYGKLYRWLRSFSCPAPPLASFGKTKPEGNLVMVPPASCVCYKEQLFLQLILEHKKSPSTFGYFHPTIYSWLQSVTYSHTPKKAIFSPMEEWKLLERWIEPSGYSLGGKDN